MKIYICISLVTWTLFLDFVAPMDTTQGAQLLRGRFGEVRGIYYGSHMHLFQYDKEVYQNPETKAWLLPHNALIFNKDEQFIGKILSGIPYSQETMQPFVPPNHAVVTVGENAIAEWRKPCFYKLHFEQQPGQPSR